MTAFSGRVRFTYSRAGGALESGTGVFAGVEDGLLLVESVRFDDGTESTRAGWPVESTVRVWQPRPELLEFGADEPDGVHHVIDRRGRNWHRQRFQTDGHSIWERPGLRPYEFGLHWPSLLQAFGPVEPVHETNQD